MSAPPETDLEALLGQRAALLEGLAAICADIDQELDPDPSEHVAELERADALDRRASAAEAELEEIENRLAEASARGVRRRW